MNRRDKLLKYTKKISTLVKSGKDLKLIEGFLRDRIKISFTIGEPIWFSGKRLARVGHVARVYGRIVKCNNKSAKVKTKKHGIWNVAYDVMHHDKKKKVKV